MYAKPRFKENPVIDAAQIRAARALLDWNRDQLAAASGVSVPALAKIEGNKSTPHAETLVKIQAALEQAGVLFGDSSGVKRKNEIVRLYEGTSGVKLFADELYTTAVQHGGEFLISGGNQSDFFAALDKDFLDMHAARMASLKNFHVRALKPQSRPEESGLSYIKFRWVPDQMFFSVPFYVYHNRLAIILWNSPRIVILDDARVATAYATQFETLWKLGSRQPESR